VVTASSPVGFSATPLQGTLTRTDPNGTFCATTADVNGANSLTGVSTQTTGTCPTLNFANVSIDPTTAAAGIYTLTAVARDVAGNVSGTITRRFVIDRVPPVVTNAVPGTGLIRGNSATTFNATATDNLSIVGSLAVENFAAPTEINLRFDGQALGSAFAAPFTRSSPISVTIPQFIRAIALQPSVDPAVTANTNVFTTVTGVAVGATDAGNNAAYGVIAGTTINALLDQTQLPTPQFFGLPNSTQSIEVRFTPNNTTTSSIAAATQLFGGTGAVTTPSSLTITFRQLGLTNTPFTSPFQRIEVWQRSTLPGSAQAGAIPFATTTAYTFLGTFARGGVTVFPNAASQINNTFTYTPTSFPSSGNTTNVDLLILAVDANGYAAAFIAPTITLNP
jgi:hypothetical protein